MYIEKSDIKINFYDDILGHMDRDQKIELAEMLCMEDEVLDYFLNELMRAYAGPNVDSHIHKARQRFADLMPEAAVQLIRALNAEVQRTKDEAEHYREKSYSLWQRYPTHAVCQKCGESFNFHRPEEKAYPITHTPSSDQIMTACGLEPVKVQTSDGWDA